MPVVLPPGLTLARCGQPLAHAVEIAVLALPMVIATLALIPALIICPFLSAAHRDLVIGLLWRACGSGRSRSSGRARSLVLVLAGAVRLRSVRRR